MDRHRLQVVVGVVCAVLYLSLVPSAPAQAGWIDKHLIPKQYEIELGRGAAAQLERNTGLCSDQQLCTRVSAIGYAIVEALDSRDYSYEFKVLSDDTLGACACPGGWVYVSQGLARVASDDELAAVLGHEVGHVVARHGVRSLVKAVALDRILDWLKGGGDPSLLEQVLIGLVLNAYSREYEEQADYLGQVYAFKARYDPMGMLLLLQRLQSTYGKERLPEWFLSHPPIDDRIRNARSNLVRVYLECGDLNPRDDCPRIGLVLTSPIHALSPQVVTQQANQLSIKLTQTGLAQVRAMDMSLFPGKNADQVAAGLGLDALLSIQVINSPQEQRPNVARLEGRTELKPLGPSVAGFTSCVIGAPFNTTPSNPNVTIQAHQRAFTQLMQPILGELVSKLM